MLDLRPMRARRLHRVWGRTTLTLIVAAFVANTVGFRWLFLPLMLLVQVCMWRTGYWDGWIDGHKHTKEQETIDA